MLLSGRREETDKTGAHTTLEMNVVLLPFIDDVRGAGAGERQGEDLGKSFRHLSRGTQGRPGLYKESIKSYSYYYFVLFFFFFPPVI